MPPRDATSWSPGPHRSERAPTRLNQIAKIKTMCGDGRAVHLSVHPLTKPIGGIDGCDRNDARDGVARKRSCGRPCRQMGLTVVHHELVEHKLAERLGVHESAVHRYLEGGASLLERWKIDKQKLSRFTAEEIIELAKKGNVVIRGWGAKVGSGTCRMCCASGCAPTCLFGSG